MAQYMKSGLTAHILKRKEGRNTTMKPEKLIHTLAPKAVIFGQGMYVGVAMKQELPEKQNGMYYRLTIKI